MKKTVPLSDVENRQGRLDVALYRLVDRAMERIETEQGIQGLREHILPIVEDALLRNVPGENLLPRELAIVSAVLKVCALNRKAED